MRFRTLIAAAGAALLAAAVPATAGSGPSQYCSDQYGSIILPARDLVTSPITFQVEFTNTPGTTYQVIYVCYSTSSTTNPNSIVGGAVAFEIYADTSTADPGAHVNVSCLGDQNTSVGPITCGTQRNSVNVGTGDALGAVQTRPSTCALWLNTGCVVSVPVVNVRTNASGTPLVSLQVANVPVNVDLPTECVSIIVPCS